MLSPSHRGPSTALPGQQHPWAGCSFCATGKHRSATSRRCLRAIAERMQVMGCSRVPPIPRALVGTALLFRLVLSTAAEVGKPRQEAVSGFLQMVPR